jgi:hypothetical protein
MGYNKNSVYQAKKRGVFQNNIIDPSVLNLEDDEKKRLREDFSKAQRDMAKDKQPDQMENKRTGNNKPEKEINIELTWFEQVVCFLLSLFKIQSIQDFKVEKALKSIEKDILRMKPSIYNASSKRVSKFLAFNLYDFYSKAAPIKQIFERTMNNSSLWNNVKQFQKTGLEMLFEKLMNYNSQEIDSKFSLQGIAKIINEFESIKEASQIIDKAIYNYINTIDPTSAEFTNKIYTNILYIKKLLDFDFVQLFKRFDSQFSEATSPYFIDIAGDAIVPYLVVLEEDWMQVDLNLDNVSVFKTLAEIGNILCISAQGSTQNQDQEEIPKDEAEPTKPEEIEGFFNVLKDTITRNPFTPLLKLMKRLPDYSPVLFRSKYDLSKLYAQTFEERVKNLVKEVVENKKIHKIEQTVKKIFNSIQWAGLYSNEISSQLQENGSAGFLYIYPIGIANTFISECYEPFTKGLLNIVLMNGIFIEKYFQKSLAENFYDMEKFEDKFREFLFEMSIEGYTGKRISGLLKRQDSSPSETRKNMEKYVTTINTKAKELMSKFFTLFFEISEIVVKLYKDSERKTPDHVRNMRSIGGLKNQKLLASLEKSYTIVSSLKEAVQLLRE